MQKCFQHLLLIRVLVICGFTFQMPVHANTTPISHPANTSSAPMEDMVCTEQGCLKTHDACGTHCVRQSKEQPTTVALTIPYNHQPMSNMAERSFSFQDFHQTNSSVTAQHRAPPSHQWLRSVMKRE